MLKIAVPQWGMGQAKAEQGLQSQDSRMNQYEFRRENLRGLCGLFKYIYSRRPASKEWPSGLGAS